MSKIVPIRCIRLLAWTSLTITVWLVVYKLNTVFNSRYLLDANSGSEITTGFDYGAQEASITRESTTTAQDNDDVGTERDDVSRTTFEKPVDEFRAKKLQVIYDHLNVTSHNAKFPAFEIGENLLSNDNVCSDADSIDLLILVHTSPVHFERRQQIRNTFANTELFLPYQVRVVFLMGIVAMDDSLLSDIYQEHHDYKDTVVGSFLDDYHNLTLKGVMGLRWINQHCPYSDFILKIDDDVIVDTYKLLQNYLPHMTGKTKSYFCNVWRKNMRIERSGKWMVPPNVFSGRNTFPYYYCSGFTLLFTSDLVTPLYEAAKITPFFWIDDLYLFGMLPKVVGNVTFYDYQISKNITLNQDHWMKCVDRAGSQCPYFSTLVKQESYWSYWDKIQSLHDGTHWTPLVFHEE